MPITALQGWFSLHLIDEEIEAQKVPGDTELAWAWTSNSSLASYTFQALSTTYWCILSILERLPDTRHCTVPVT